MNTINRKKDHYLTGAVIVVAVFGIIYFGYQAVIDVMSKSDDNPFEYNIEYFKKSDSTLNLYEEINQIALNLNQPLAIAMGYNNELCASGDNLILTFNKDGKLQSTIKCGEAVRALAIDINGDIFAGKEDHIEIFSKEGSPKARWDSPGEKALITSLAVTDHYVFVADAGSFIVWKYDKSGNLLKRIGEKDSRRDIPGFIIPSPYFDVAIDPDGFLWVVNPGRHSLENYTLEGDMRSSWGEYSMTVEGFCGCCNPTHLAILPDGSFVTSEKGIVRVKVYNRIGQLTAVVAGPNKFREDVTGLDLAVDNSGLIYVLDPDRKVIRIFSKKSDSTEEVPGVSQKSTR